MAGEEQAHHPLKGRKMVGKNVIVRALGYNPGTQSNGHDEQPGIVTCDWSPSSQVRSVNVKVFNDCGPVWDATSIMFYPTKEVALHAGGNVCWPA
jgi:hypothetical protein